MNVNQAYQIANSIFAEALGDSAVLKEDLSNLVDIGRAYAQVVGNTWLDNYAKGVINKIGRTIFVDRVYRGRTPSLLREDWEYGSALEKIDAEVGDFVENESWDLVDGQTYNQDEFHAPVIHAKVFNTKSTFELDLSKAEIQIKESLKSAAQLVAFFSMIETKIENKLTKATSEFMKRALNNMIGITIHGANGNRAVNLLSLYNATLPAGQTALTFPACLTDKDFLRFASFTMKLFPSRLQDMSVLFNEDGRERFTPADRLQVILWDKFQAAAGTYLIDANGQFLTDDLKLPEAETVSYWQGSGLTYADADTSKIDVVTSEGDTVSQTGILGVMFDRDAVMVANYDRRVRTHVNDKAEFINSFWKCDMGLICDPSENFIVFYCG